MDIIERNIRRINSTLISNIDEGYWFREESFIPNQLMHYTNSWSAHEIINSHAMRATHAAYLNDGAELSYAFGIVKSAINRRQFDFPLNNETKRIVDIFLSYISSGVNILGLSSDVYVTSFTTLLGSLSQYRMYGGDVSGVCLAFDSGEIVKRLSQVSLGSPDPIGKMKRCIYDTEEQIRCIWNEFSHCISIIDTMNLGFVGNDSDGAWLDHLMKKICFALYPVAAAIKHPSFADEREFRAIFLRRPVLVGHSGFSEKNGLVRPHILWRFGTENQKCTESGWPPKFLESALRRVYVGPGIHQIHNFRSFNWILHYNTDRVVVERFDSPYRG